MQQPKGYIGIIVLIILATIVGIFATYWYLTHGAVSKVEPLQISVTDVPSDGTSNLPYKPIVDPEPTTVDPNYQVYEQDLFSFEYPITWETILESDGVQVRDTKSASSSVTLTTSALGFPSSFKKCKESIAATSSVGVLSIDFLCDSKATSKDKNIVWLVVDTQKGYRFFGQVIENVKMKEDDIELSYMDVFTRIVSSFSLKTI